MDYDQQPIPPMNHSLIAVLAWVLGIFTFFIGPLVIYLMVYSKTAPEDQLTREAVRNALNWQLTVLVVAIVGTILVIVFIGIFILAAIKLLSLVFCIIGAVKAAQGTAWQSPMTIPFLR